MNKLICIILLFAGLASKAQDSQDSIIVFQVSCGFGGTTSPEILGLRVFTSSKNYFFLRKKLFGDNRTEAVLSAISLSELHKKKSLVLKEDDLARISEIRKWNLPYALCVGCTGHYGGLISDLLGEKWNLSYVTIRDVLFRP